VFGAIEPNIAIVAGEGFDYGVLTVGVLGAIDAPPREQTRDLRDADAEHLIGQDMVYALFEVWNFLLQPFD
jgi:hypothetical protein